MKFQLFSILLVCAASYICAQHDPTMEANDLQDVSRDEAMVIDQDEQDRLLLFGGLGTSGMSTGMSGMSTGKGGMGMSGSSMSGMSMSGNGDERVLYEQDRLLLFGGMGTSSMSTGMSGMSTGMSGMSMSGMSMSGKGDERVLYSYGYGKRGMGMGGMGMGMSGMGGGMGHTGKRGSDYDDHEDYSNGKRKGYRA